MHTLIHTAEYAGCVCMGSSNTNIQTYSKYLSYIHFYTFIHFIFSTYIRTYIHTYIHTHQLVPLLRRTSSCSGLSLDVRTADIKVSIGALADASTWFFTFNITSFTFKPAILPTHTYIHTYKMLDLKILCNK